MGATALRRRKVPECKRRLAVAGVDVLDPWPPDGGLVTPVDVAWSASSVGPDEGRVDRPFEDTDPDRISGANAAWLQVAEQSGLFGVDGTFLVGVRTGDDDDPVSTWFKARVRPEFDLFGVGAQEGVLGYGWGVPEFVMHSADGEVLIAASSYESLFSIIVVPRPYRVSALRRSAQLVLDTDGSGEMRIAVAQWLDRDRLEPPAG